MFREMCFCFCACLVIVRDTGDGVAGSTFPLFLSFSISIGPGTCKFRAKGDQG